MKYQQSMLIGCNIWMICLELNWLFYDPSWTLQFSEFVWTLRSSVWVVFNNFLLIDATDRSKISSDQKRLFFAVSLYPLSFFANTPFNNLIFVSWTLNRDLEHLLPLFMKEFKSLFSVHETKICLCNLI